MQSGVVPIFLLISHALAYKVLIYSPTIGHSHVKFMGKIADTLIDAGHDVVMFLYLIDLDIQTNGTNRAPVIRFQGVQDRTAWSNSSIKSDPFDENSFLMNDDILKIFADIDLQACEALMTNDEMLQQLRALQFDVAIVEVFDLCAFGILKLINVEAVISTTALPLLEIISDQFGLPEPLSYVPNIYHHFSDEMSYWERITNVRMSRVWRSHNERLMQGQNAAFRKHYGQDFPSLDALARRSALAFINSDELVDFPRPISHKIVFVGGIGVLAPKNLSAEMLRIVEEAPAGVIFLSFGSLANSTTMQPAKKAAVLEMIAAFPQYHFIWKYEQPDEARTVFRGYKNLHLVEWAPQVDLLYHPRVKAFITHGGLNSITEAIYSGTPMVTIPLFGDQFHNVATAVKRGVAVRVDKNALSKETLVAALSEVLENPRYLKNVQRLSAMVAKKPLKPRDLIVKWTEFVAEFHDLSNLDLAGQNFSFAKYFLIDIIASVLVVSAAMILVCIKIIRVKTCRKEKRA